MDNIAALLEGKIHGQIQKEAHAGHTGLRTSLSHVILLMRKNGTTK